MNSIQLGQQGQHGQHGVVPRFQLHSHDSFGLGHLRRTMTLAEALHARHPRAQILITTGSPCATHFAHSAGIDLVKVPSVTKNSAGQYVARTPGVELESVLRLRRQILGEVQRNYAPHVLIVDHQVLGLCDELSDVLRLAHAHGTRTILGMRDIIDAPESVAREWGRPRARRALAEEYDRVCVYGAPEIFDPRVEYPIPTEIRQRVEFVGYIARPASHVPHRRLSADRRRAGGRPRVLVTVGGGDDGAERIETYFEALELGRAPWDSTVVLGPLCAPELARSFEQRARALPDVELQRFNADLPRALEGTDAVVGMAGYNSVVEILQSRVPAVLCPRSFPRREQLMRAQRLDALGLVECIATPTAETLRAAVERALERGAIEAPLPPMNGAEKLCDVAGELLQDALCTAEPSRVSS